MASWRGAGSDADRHDGTVEDRFGESMNREAEKDAGPPWRVFPTGNFFYFFEGSKLMAVRFDPKTASFSAHREVKFMPGSTVTLCASGSWTRQVPVAS